MLFTIMDILITREDSCLSAQEKLTSNPQATQLQIDQACLEDREWQSLIKYFNEELITLNAFGIRLNDKTFLLILQRCRLLQNLKFVDCLNLTAECMPHIGTLLDHLRTIHFEYTKGATWPDHVDVLSVLVKNCTSDLTEIAFIGFNSVSDVGICYAAECYTNSLTSLNISNCSQISDRALLGVADWSKLIKQVSFNRTSVSDKGLQQIAAKCKRLKKVNFGNCEKISDKGVKRIAESLYATLEEINVENCLKVSDASLYSVIYNCAQLKWLQFDGTSISNVPPHILALRKLKTVSFNGCKKLIKNMGNVTEDLSLEKLFEKYKGYYIPYRLRLFLLGDKGSGKSSLLKSWKSGEPCTCDKSTLGVNVTQWYPLKYGSNERRRSIEDKLLLECYDVSGSKLTEAIPSIFFTKESLYIIVFNAAKPDSVRNIVRHVKNIHCKAPGSRILVIGTHGDSITTETADVLKNDVLVAMAEAEKNWRRNIEQEIASVRELGCDLKFQDKSEELNTLLRTRPRYPTSVHIVSCTSGMELLNAKESLITAALDYNQFHHLGRSLKPTTVETLQHVYQLREEGQLIVGWERFSQLVINPHGLVSSEDALNTVIRLLHDVGLLHDLQFLEYDGSKQTQHRYICSNPPVLADIMCLIHQDLKSSNEKLDIKRFWPKGQKVSRPDPGVLVKSMEQITNKGILRESLVPLVLQKYVLCQDQVLNLLDVLEKIGFLTKLHERDDHTDESMPEIRLHDFQGLNFRTKYRLSLFQLPFSHKPHIHWTSKPHKGDIQVNWSYQFPNGTPVGTLQRLISKCYLIAVRMSATYIHSWTYGVLCRIGEAFICVEEDNYQINVCCRTLADEPGQESTHVQYMWAQLAPFLFVAEIIMLSSGGLFYKTQLTAFGNALHGGVVILREKPLSVMMCIDLTQKGENFSFEDDGMSRYVDIKLLFPYDFTQFLDVFGWITHLVEHRETITSLVDDEDFMEVPRKISKLNRQDSKRRRKLTRSTQSITFSEDISYIEYTSPTCSHFPPIENEVDEIHHPSTKDNKIIKNDNSKQTNDLEENSTLVSSSSSQGTQLPRYQSVDDSDPVCDPEIEGSGQFYTSLSPNCFQRESITDYRSLEGRQCWQIVKLCLDLLVNESGTSVTPIVMKQKGTQTDMSLEWQNELFHKVAGKIVTEVILKAAIKVARERNGTNEKVEHNTKIEVKNKRNSESNSKDYRSTRNEEVLNNKNKNGHKTIDTSHSVQQEKTSNNTNTVISSTSHSMLITNNDEKGDKGHHSSTTSKPKTKVCVIL